MHPRACGLCQGDDGHECQAFCQYGHAAQAHAGSLRTAGCRTCPQPGVLRAQPNGVAESGGILQGAQQHLRVLNGFFSLTEADAARLGQRITVMPLPMAVRVTARMAAFIPGASPPEVNTPMR